jgi:hypothetical protein
LAAMASRLISSAYLIETIPHRRLEDHIIELHRRINRKKALIDEESLKVYNAKSESHTPSDSKDKSCNVHRV